MMSKNNSFWIVSTVVLVGIIAALIVPGSALAQGSAYETERALADFEQVFRFIQNNYVEEVDTDVLLEGALEGLLDSLGDPHSSYIKEEALRSLNDTTSGSFGGVGMYISKQQQTDDETDTTYIEVVAPIDDTPAALLGVRANDLITHIDDMETTDMSIDEAVDLLRGRPGASVNVRINRNGYSFELDIVRAVIQVPSIRYGFLDDDAIGYIRIIQFTPNTYDRITEAVSEFERTGYGAIIIDVRQNPGGLLSSAVDVAGAFLDNKLVVGTSGRDNREVRTYRASHGTLVPNNIPVVVLVDAGSASASEILAGALKDHNRATIIGEQTFGKGSVQQIRQVDAGAFRLTMSLYYTPSGNYIDSIGIVPDIIAKSAELTEEQTEDLTNILRNRVVERFVDNRSVISQSDIDAFVSEQLVATSLESRDILKLVRDEINRANNEIPAFDLEYDEVLNVAIEHINS